VRYYLDCEFDGFGGALMSLALVREDGLRPRERAAVSDHDCTPQTKQARRVTRRLRLNGLEVTSESAGGEVRVTLPVVGETPIVVHCQVDTPVEVVEEGVRGWLAKSAEERARLTA
jgi:hypothetical protein